MVVELAQQTLFSMFFSVLLHWIENVYFFFHTIFRSSCSPPCPEMGRNLATKIIANVPSLCSKDQWACEVLFDTQQKDMCCPIYKSQSEMVIFLANGSLNVFHKMYFK